MRLNSFEFLASLVLDIFFFIYIAHVKPTEKSIYILNRMCAHTLGHRTRILPTIALKH